MGEKKRAKKQSRTRIEICNENANKLVSKTENFLKTAQDLKDKINGLGGKEFSQMAIGFNNLINESIDTLTPLPFESTEREETTIATTKTGKTFADYQKEKPEPESEKAGEDT